MDAISVVLAADNNYAMQLAVVLRSMFENFKGARELVLYVIDGGISPANKYRILRSLTPFRPTLNWLPATAEMIGKNLKVSGHISATAYFRLLIPKLLPHKINKAIYLDSDLIVNQDISKLWEIDIQDNYLLAVQDLGIPYVSSPYGLVNYKELGISPICKYLNSGVLVMNLKRWRSDNIAEQIIHYLENHQDLVRFWDQDGLNAVLAGQWGELDPRWNQTPAIYTYSSWKESPFSEETYNNLIYDPYIIHFAHAAKPWNSREFYPANDLFFEYVDKTAWKGWRLTVWRRFYRRLNREIKHFQKKFLAA